MNRVSIWVGGDVERDPFLGNSLATLDDSAEPVTVP